MTEKRDGNKPLKGMKMSGVTPSGTIMLSSVKHKSEFSRSARNFKEKLNQTKRKPKIPEAEDPW